MAWLVWCSLAALCAPVLGHGRVLDPPGRGTAWRAGFPAKPDYDDDGLNCGGFYHQWSVNGGRCGVCGDAYDSPTPRAHELGGTYGQGDIVASYRPGASLRAVVDLTASHKGYWEFRLCPDPLANQQDCFDKYLLQLEHGGTKYYPTEGSTKYAVTYKLPEGLICEHCVLQWKYTAGNNWGVCANGTQGLGCGNQEEFRACSDVSVTVARTHDVETLETVPEGYEEIPYPLFFYLRHGFFDLEQGKEVNLDVGNEAVDLDVGNYNTILVSGE
ncbi:unnamed protein product [Plutella xylostella]|uniref:(diamondback moth) hypothetical protein n=1 Tax=Plutella xylostella TaxID=51655 RepID=A0A8S4FNK5_PLUXY|nr:unnamed protein product [Plutella xylostella]